MIYSFNNITKSSYIM